MFSSKPHQFIPGFRCSRGDCLVLLFGVVVSVGLLLEGLFQLGLIVIWVVGHFFLFCNVVRMARVRELIWAVILLLLFCFQLDNHNNIYYVYYNLLLSFSLTLILLLFEIRSSNYHGVFWKQFNPHLKIN